MKVFHVNENNLPVRMFSSKNGTNKDYSSFDLKSRDLISLLDSSEGFWNAEFDDENESWKQKAKNHLKKIQKANSIANSFSCFVFTKKRGEVNKHSEITEHI